jgi:hypothetical protein
MTVGAPGHLGDPVTASLYHPAPAPVQAALDALLRVKEAALPECEVGTDRRLRAARFVATLSAPAEQMTHFCPIDAAMLKEGVHAALTTNHRGIPRRRDGACRGSIPTRKGRLPYPA